MAYRYAVLTGNWSSGSIWDSGQPPAAGDDVFTNGYTVTLDQDIDVGSLRNSGYIWPIVLPNQQVPLMTGPATPQGSAFASSGTQNAWLAFDQATGTFWSSATANAASITYQFTSSLVIKRYAVRGIEATYGPKNWTFEGSNDGSSWTVMDTVSGSAVGNYFATSSIMLNNSSSFSYYKLNVTACQTLNNGIRVYGLEMTNTTASVYHVNSGGSYVISGSRNVLLSSNDSGIYGNVSSGTTITIPAVTGSTVNISSTSLSGRLFNTNWCAYNIASAAGINITGPATVNLTGHLYSDSTYLYNTNDRCVNITNTGTATVNIIGNSFGTELDSYTAPRGTCAIKVESGINTINITGTVNGSTVLTGMTAIYHTGGTTTLNITGNCLAGTSPAIESTAGTININHLNGTAQASTAAHAIYNQSAGITRPSLVVNNTNIMGILATRMQIRSGSATQWVFQNTSGSNTSLYAAGGPTASLGLPLTTDVRYLTTYGPNSELVGSLRVAAPQYVSQGVPTDNTTGSAQLTAADFLSAISSSSDPLAIRLRNVATVDTVGGQIAAFTP